MSVGRSVSRILVQRAGAIVVLAGLTVTRLLTDLGMRSDQATEFYVLAMTAVVLWWCHGPLVRAVSPDRPQAPPGARADLGERPERLLAVEEAVAWAVRSPYVRDRRLRPDLRTLLGVRLRREGIDLARDLDSDPRVAAVLGPTGSWLAGWHEEADLDDRKPGLTTAQLLELAEALSTLDQRLTTHVRQTGEQH